MSYLCIVKHQKPIIMRHLKFSVCDFVVDGFNNFHSNYFVCRSTNFSAKYLACHPHTCYTLDDNIYISVPSRYRCFYTQLIDLLSLFLRRRLDNPASMVFRFCARHDRLMILVFSSFDRYLFGAYVPL